MMKDLLSLTVTVDISSRTNEAYAQRFSRTTNVSTRNVFVMSFRFVGAYQRLIEEDLQLKKEIGINFESIQSRRRIYFRTSASTEL